MVRDIVLIVDENSPRCSWPLGRVTEVRPNKDGYVRRASLKTKSGTTLERPASKIVFLESDGLDRGKTQSSIEN